MWLYEQSSSELSFFMDYMSVVLVQPWTPMYPAIFRILKAMPALPTYKQGSVRPNTKWATQQQRLLGNQHFARNASSTCPHYLPSLAQDNTRLMSQGASNTRLYTLSGRVFQDKNVNGLDDSETGWCKVTVVLQKRSAKLHGLILQGLISLAN